MENELERAIKNARKFTPEKIQEMVHDSFKELITDFSSEYVEVHRITLLLGDELERLQKENERLKGYLMYFAEGRHIKETMWATEARAFARKALRLPEFENGK